MQHKGLKFRFKNVQLFFVVKFLKNSFFHWKIFINMVSKICWTFFCKMFCIFDFCFLFFSVQAEESLSLLWLECLTMKRVLFSSLFLIWFLTFKNQELLLWLLCPLHCVHILHLLVCIILVLSWHLHLYSFILIFQLLNNWMISAFS